MTYIPCSDCVELEDGSYACTRPSSLVSKTANRLNHEFEVQRPKTPPTIGISTV
jgi:hypothetical protein